MNTYEKMRPLNTTDGWEELVNGNAVMRASARERVAARKRDCRLKKMQMAICVMAVASLASVILGAAGSAAGWLATVSAVVCLVASSMLLGRYVEAKKA